METLTHIDLEVFQFINGSNTSSLDVILYYVGLRITWIPLYLALAFWIYKKSGWKTVLVAGAFAGVLILFTDVGSSWVIKPLFARLRPCHSDQFYFGEVHLLQNKCGGLYGFVSSHAANFFGLAFFVLVAFGKQSKVLPITFFLTAILVSYSRVYAGVHYPADVFFGAMYGMIIGFLVGYGFIQFNKNTNFRDLIA